MNITIPKFDLLRAVARCSPIANKRSAMPVLSCVHIEPIDDGVSFTSTDMFTSVRAAVQCEANGDAFAVPASDLADRVKHMPDGPIRLAYAAGRLVVTAPGSARRFTLLAHPGNEFPRVEFADGGETCALPAASLAAAIDAVRYAVSVDETRAHVNSALFDWSAGKLTMVATDGHRLSKSEVGATCEKAAILVPLRALGELRKLCDGPGIVTLRIAGPSLVVEPEGIAVQFSTKLVDAQFPPYSQVIPKSCERTVVAPVAALASAISAVALASPNRTGGVSLSFVTGLIRVTSESPEAGNAHDEVPCESVGAEVTFGVNAKYVLDVLGVLTVDEVSIGLSGPLDPMLMTAPGGVFVVMPMRI